MATKAKITIIDVMREVGIQPTRKLTVSVGNAVRRRWKAENHGELPQKELRPKTNGAGSHCIAVYPPEWRGEILGTITAIQNKTWKHV